MRRLVLLTAGLAAGLVTATGAVLAATVNVNVGNYYFEDATIGDGKVTARVGDQLRLTVVDRGTDGRPHTADVDGLGFHSGALQPGSTWVSPVITKPGTFQLYCKVHLRSQNHQTTLVVSGTAITPAPSRAPTPTRTSATVVPSAPGTVGASALATEPAASRQPPSVSPGPSTSGPPLEASSPTPSTDGEILEPGVSGGIPGDWARSVRVGLLALVPIALLAALAAWRARAVWRPRAERDHARPWR
jgi:hypothetical protein